MAMCEMVGTRPKGYYTIKELAKAMNMSERHAYRWVESKGARTAKCRIGSRVVTVYGV